MHIRGDIEASILNRQKAELNVHANLITGLWVLCAEMVGETSTEGFLVNYFFLFVSLVDILVMLHLLSTAYVL